ncbi:MAG: response regulator [Leptolyngbyaceae bacterium]|nr:response regulator [Leptolyngbyaceae bacterium]
MGTKTVLLIDHEETVREVIQSCLEDLAGWDVLTVSSLPEGLQQAIDKQPDAIILDFFTADMGVVDITKALFLEQLRGNPKTATIPVILLTAQVRWLSSQMLQHYQVLGAIAKPFDPEHLLRKIAQLLQWDLELPRY